MCVRSRYVRERWVCICLIIWVYALTWITCKKEKVCEVYWDWVWEREREKEREREREISNEERVDKKENFRQLIVKKSKHHQEKENEEKKE